ncbi:MAG: heavy metal translocating P-type ATPase [Oscillospiraceae bacterium]
MNREEKINLTRIILAAALFVTAALVPSSGTFRLIAYLIIYILVAYDVLISAVKNILKGEVFDENFLMAIASLGAFAIGEYPEAVAVMLFYQVGELFQDLAVGKSRKSIAALMDIRPDYAHVLREGVEETVSPEAVHVGDTILIKPGERVPLDGKVLEGGSSLNTAALTGEALPRDVAPGDTVFSGAVNLNGVIKVSVTSEYGDSTVSKILDLVENAYDKKAKSESFITRFAKYYTPCVVIAAALLAIIPPLFFAQEWSVWINRALIFLVVSCPCALVISVPLSFFGGIGGASRHGILIKGANYLEALSKTKTLVFDKTGTLTQGSFEVTAIHPETVSEAELLEIAATVEIYSSHPIAESLLRAHGKTIDKSRLGEISELSGLGIKAVLDGQEVYLGNARLMTQIGADFHDCHKLGTTIHVALGKEYMGHIVIADELKPDAKQAISRLRSTGVSKIVMLTGDSRAVGEAVGRELSLDETQSELLPADKVSAIEKLLSDKPQGTALTFVGDGINDAPSLSRADVGVAMGALGSDAAIEAADIVLMDDKPSKIALAIQISRKTMTIVRQNIVFALGIKAVVLVLGALGFANMWFAVFADVGVMILAILNAIRTLYIKPKY